jgi:two-component system phosphate regulon response regulator PhoB
MLGLGGYMQRVTILSTFAPSAEFEPFSQGDTTFTFEHLPADGPRRLIEGQGWAFIDWIMPDLSGLEMCRRLRADQRTRAAHVTMELERDDLDDRRRALRAGADDYIVGPISRQIILDRILALQSGELAAHPSKVIEIGPLAVNVSAEQARWDGKHVPLSRNGFRVLRYLAENPNRIITRRELIEALGKGGDPDYLRTVDVWIKRLRAGLKQVGASHALRTVQGKGYVLDLP